MFEYKVQIFKVRDAEKEMNRLAQSGWRVITVSPDITRGYGIVVTFERQLNK